MLHFVQGQWSAVPPDGSGSRMAAVMGTSWMQLSKVKNPLDASAGEDVGEDGGEVIDHAPAVGGVAVVHGAGGIAEEDTAGASGAVGKAGEAAGDALRQRLLLGPPHLARRGGCWFEQDSLKVRLGVEADFKPARKTHPAFIVSGLRELVARLQARGHRVVEDQPHEGYNRRYVDDPFGNLIESMEADTSASDDHVAGSARAPLQGSVPLDLTDDLVAEAIASPEMKRTGPTSEVARICQSDQPSWCDAGYVLSNGLQIGDAVVVLTLSPGLIYA